MGTAGVQAQLSSGQTRCGGRAERTAGVGGPCGPQASRSSFSPQQPFSSLHLKFRKRAEPVLSPAALPSTAANPWTSVTGPPGLRAGSTARLAEAASKPRPGCVPTNPPPAMDD